MIRIFVELCATIIDVIFLIWFVPLFNGTTIKERPKSLIWAGLLLVFQLIADRILQGATWLYAIIDCLLALSFSFSLVKKKYVWPIFAALVYVIIVMLSNTFVYTVLAVLIDGFEMVLQMESLLYIRVIYILVCKMVHFGFYKLILTFFKKDKNLDVKNGVLSFVFTMLTAVGLIALMKLVTTYSFQGMDFVVLMLSAVLVALNVILYTMIYQVQSLLRNKYELSLIKERLESERSRIEEASAIWNNIRKLKHDLKNHFTVLAGKLDQENIVSCKKYISDLYATVDNMGDLIKSGNSVIDYLINTKLSNLGNVQVLVSGYVGHYNDIEDVDLASILGNILDNAIEAQEKVMNEKRIELLFLQKNSNRIIICKNTVADSILCNNKNLKSTKGNSELHGLGHQIVESTVKKYHGIVDYFEDGNMFGVQIIIPSEMSKKLMN